MKYLSGIHALNLNSKILDTPGDWHQSALRWQNLTLLESEDMFFKDWGIEHGYNIPCHKEAYNTANHIRACLDLLETGDFPLVEGMRDNFIETDKYDDIIFDKVSQMRCLDNWELIDKFMCNEYMMKWITYKERMIQNG